MEEARDDAIVQGRTVIMNDEYDPTQPFEPAESNDDHQITKEVESSLDSADEEDDSNLSGIEEIEGVGAEGTILWKDLAIVQSKVPHPKGPVFAVRDADDLFVAATGDSKVVCLCCLAMKGPRKCIKSSAKGNELKHFRSHLKKDELNNVDLSHLEGFEGVRLQYEKPKKADIAKSLGATTVVKKRAITPVENYRLKAVNLQIRHGLAVAIVQSEEFMELVSAAAKVEKSTDLLIGRVMAENIVLKIFNDKMDAMKDALTRSSGFYMLHDCWDWGARHHILGLSIQFVEKTTEGELKLWKVPVYFRELKGQRFFMTPAELESYLEIGEDGVEDIPFTFAAAEDVEHHAKTALSKVNVTFEKLVNVLGDGAPPAREASARIKANSTLDLFREVSTDGRLCDVEDKCLAHDLGLAIKYLLGMSRPKKPENSKIPKAAPQNVLNTIAAVRSLVVASSTAKVWGQLEAMAKKLQKQLKVMHVDMEVRWLSTWNMLVSFIDNFEVLKSFCEKDVDGAFSDHRAKVFTFQLEDFLHLEAVLRPLMLATIAVGLSKPVAAFSLPLVYCLLATFGVDVTDGILVKEIPCKTLIEMKTRNMYKFRTRDQNYVAAKDLRPIAQDLLIPLQQHLVYRLIKNRKNFNGLELLATFCDPVANKTFESVCGSQFEIVRNHIFYALEQWRSENVISEPGAQAAIAQQTVTNNPSEDVDDEPELIAHTRSTAPSTLTSFETELAEYDKIVLNLKWAEGDKITFSNLLTTVGEWNPLEFWSSKLVQHKLPSFLHFNTIVLGSPTTTLFLESMFSSAGHTLDDRRRMLLQNPPYLEALTLLRSTLAHERIEKKDAEKERTARKKGEKRKIELPPELIAETAMSKRPKQKA